jgi:hypothetical protein
MRINLRTYEMKKNNATQTPIDWLPLFSRSANAQEQLEKLHVNKIN